MNYLTQEEFGMSRKDVDRQIAFGLKSCRTIEDVLKLLEDVRKHERSLIPRRNIHGIL